MQLTAVYLEKLSQNTANLPIEFELDCNHGIADIAATVTLRFYNGKDRDFPCVVKPDVNKLLLCPCINANDTGNSLYGRIQITTPTTLYHADLDLEFKADRPTKQKMMFGEISSMALRAFSQSDADIYAANVIDNPALDSLKHNSGSRIKREPLKLKQSQRTDVTNQAGYVRLKAGENTYVIQAFRNKVSIGKGDKDPRQDSNIRLFQTLMMRQNHPDKLIDNNFQPQEIRKISRTHLWFEFKNNQLKWVGAGRSAKQPQVSGQLKDLNLSPKFERDHKTGTTSSFIFDDIGDFRNGCCEFTLEYKELGLSFNIAYTQGISALISCNGRHEAIVGDIILINSANSLIDQLLIDLPSNPDIKIKTENGLWKMGFQNNLKEVTCNRGEIFEL